MLKWALKPNQGPKSGSSFQGLEPKHQGNRQDVGAGGEGASLAGVTELKSVALGTSSSFSVAPHNANDSGGSLSSREPLGFG